ncbi:MAG: hypothetical protein U5L45_22875 [Saprospiraceae bacterium]|nr:hypothetical protein [Saprospiraceae bacterium]
MRIGIEIIRTLLIDFLFFRNYLVTRSLRSRELGEVVRFSGFTRKTNHILLFCA